MNIKFYAGVKQLVRNKKNSMLLKSTIAFCTASVLLVSAAGCSNNSDDTTSDTSSVIEKYSDTESLNSTNTSSTLVVSSEIVENNSSESSSKVSDTSSKSNNKETDTDKKELTYLEQWNRYEENMWSKVSKISDINISRKDFKTTLLILNSDYLKSNHPEVIQDYIANTKGINSMDELFMNDELTTFYNVLSQVRAYNMDVKDAKNYFSLNYLLVDKSQTDVLNKIEENAKICIDLENKYNTGKATEEDYKKAKEVFDFINSFQLGNSRIEDVSANDLSNGGQFVAEESMKIMSLKLVNFIKYNDKEYISSDKLLKFANSLNSKRAVANVQTDWYFMAGQVIGTNETTNEEEIKNIKTLVMTQTQTLYKEVVKMGVTQEEINALYTIANIDYFVKNSNTKKVFNEMYSDGFDLAVNLALAESAVEKIEIYNLNVKDKKDLYDYSHLFIESVEDIYSVMYVSSESFKIHNGDKKEALDSAKNLVDYSAYSKDFSIVVNVDGKDVKYNKKSLNLGGTQVVNFITYYAFLNNKSKIDNEQLYKDGIKLVDGTTEISDVQSQIYWMLEDECLKKDKTSQYKIGSKK